MLVRKLLNAHQLSWQIQLGILPMLAARNLDIEVLLIVSLYPVRKRQTKSPKINLRNFLQMGIDLFHMKSKFEHKSLINTNYSRDEIHQILDSQGRLVGLFLPPSLSPDEIESVSQAMDTLYSVSRKYAGKKRGEFKVLIHGFQKGGGSIVSLQL
jgi:hypothetical protein